jgi:hypothetical protein
MKVIRNSGLPIPDPFLDADFKSLLTWAFSDICSSI